MNSPICDISDINHVVYINLDSRPDRKLHVERELTSIGILSENITRFSAIELNDGALGCSLSHLNCIRKAKEANWPHILLVEDDIRFIDIPKFKEQFSKLLKTIDRWDVVLLAGNNVGPYTIVSNCAVKIEACQTTTGYLVKQEYYDTLITNFENGIQNLMKYPNLRPLYAIDKYWFSLQTKDTWLMVYPLYGTQCISYSNIEQRSVNYDTLMLRLDKSIPPGNSMLNLVHTTQVNTKSPVPQKNNIPTTRPPIRMNMSMIRR